MKTISQIMPHQQTAVDKLLPLRVGALFMEMGTGKSRTAIELAVRRQVRIWNVVWFCPVSLKETIRAEILKHTDAESDDVYLFDHRTRQSNIPAADWVIIGIESMSASKRVIMATNTVIQRESMVIVDESSYIKGYRSKRTDWITRISERSRYRLILTGTPISQGVVDLYSQMKFLSTRILGYRSFYSFAANHLEYSERFPGKIAHAHNTEWLAAKIQPYTYQVTKKECLTLQDKLWEGQYFNMTGIQAEMYATAKEEIFELYKDDEDGESYMIFRLFNALQQITCGFWRRTTAPGRPFLRFKHKRIETLMNTLERLDAEKVIIWAKFRYDIDGIMNALQSAWGQACAVDFHGGMNEHRRNDQVNKFRRQARFFVATPSCGGHGLTLNEASNVIFYNNCFKYAERIQAEDRCHRIGQESRVLYVDIVCNRSIDERIHNALCKKGNVVDAFKKEVEKVKKQKGNEMKELIKAL